MIKNSQQFGKKCLKTAEGDFLTHTVDIEIVEISKLKFCPV